MKLYSLTDTILTLASAVPNRGTQFCGDIYHISEIADASYPAFVLTNREVYQNRDEYYEDHHVIMFEFDRLTESQDNNLDVQSHSIQTLKAIVDKLEELGCIISVAQYTPFVQRFSDMCSGAMADVRLRIPIDACYEYSFEIGDLIDLKDLYVTKNGNYIAAPNTAYKSVVVNVEGGGGTDLKYYHEDVDESTNAQIKVNNNVVQVNRDGIEVYEKGGNRVNIDYDGVCVFTEVGAKLTWNDSKVLTTNDLDDVNTEISEIKSDIPTFPTIINAENEMVGVNDLPSYIARTVNYENRTYTLVGAFYYSNEIGNIPDVYFSASFIDGYPYSEKRLLTVYGLDGVKVDPIRFTPTSQNHNLKTWSKHFYSSIFGMWILVYFDRSSGMLDELVITTDND